jgi:hypothetical protein
MSVQDDERERELVRMFNLEWDATHQRAGVPSRARGCWHCSGFDRSTSRSAGLR